MDMYLKKFRFPVLPGEYTISASAGIDTVDVSAIGEVDLGSKKNLKAISFSSFFPKSYDSSYCQYPGLKSPRRCVETIQSIMHGPPCRFSITGAGVNLPVRVSSFEWKESDGTGDIYFTISLKEHRGVSIGKSQVVAEGASQPAAATAPPPTRIGEPPKQATYTVGPGDCLCSIARKELGTTDWRPLYELNKDTIGSNPNLILDGTVLKLPARG